MQHPNKQSLARARNRNNEDIVLIKSKRRCCICYYLVNDGSRKRFIQIAHIDHDRSNSKEDNLVVLCNDHHTEFDLYSNRSKQITPGEMRHYKAILEKAINDNVIGFDTQSQKNGIRFALIDIAKESIWFDMETVNTKDFSLFSYPWQGASGEGELNGKKCGDPVLDITLKNDSEDPVILTKLGIIVKKAWTQLAGLAPPQIINPFDWYKLDLKWIPDKPQWIRLPDPIGIDSKSVFRYKLQLVNYSTIVPGNFGIIALCCKTDRGIIESDNICLGA